MGKVLISEENLDNIADILREKFDSEEQYTPAEMARAIDNLMNPSLAISNITRSGTTFTAYRLDGTTFTFDQQDNNTWRPVVNNLTSTSTTACLAAAQGKNLNELYTVKVFQIDDQTIPGGWSSISVPNTTVTNYNPMGILDCICNGGAAYVISYAGTLSGGARILVNGQPNGGTVSFRIVILYKKQQ